MTTVTVTKPQNKINCSASAFYIFVHFFVVLCKNNKFCEMAKFNVFSGEREHDGDFFFFNLIEHLTPANLVPG